MRDPLCPFCKSSLIFKITTRTSFYGRVKELRPAKYTFIFDPESTINSAHKILRISCASPTCQFFEEVSCTRGDLSEGEIVFDPYVWNTCICPIFEPQSADTTREPEQTNFEVLIKNEWDGIPND